LPMGSIQRQRFKISASFNQRATALARVKGVKIEL
jgi:hypothetical protein